MSCPDHTVRFDDKKWDTRYVQVRADGVEVTGKDGEVLVGGAHQITVTDRRSGVQVAYEVAGGTLVRSSGTRADELELLAQQTMPGAGRWKDHQDFAEVAAAMSSASPGITDDQVAQLLHSGVGPGLLAAYGDAGAVGATEVRRLHLSRISPEQFRSWQILDPGMQVRGAVRARGQGYTPERVLGYAEALSGTTVPGRGVVERTANLVGGTLGGGPAPVGMLWSGPAPVAPFLHQIGVSPKMLERGIAAERELPGRGAYFSRLADAMSGKEGASVQLLDYTLLRYTSPEGTDAGVHFDDATLVESARRSVRGGASVAQAVRTAVAEALEGGGGMVTATTGTQLVAALGATQITNAQPTAAALWSERVRTGDGQRRSGGDLPWQVVKDEVQRTLREGSCPQLGERADSPRGLVAFYAADERGTVGRSAPELQQMRHVYMLHPEGGCTSMCNHLARGGDPAPVVLEGAQQQLLAPMGVNRPDRDRLSGQFTCSSCFLQLAGSRRAGSFTPALCADCA